MARDLRTRRPMTRGNRTGRIPSPSNIPEAGQYQAPGTSGTTDYGLGTLYEENPDWFGPWGGGFQWDSMEDIYDSWSVWEQYLAGEMSHEAGGGSDWWEQQEAAWDWWNTWNPQESSEWSWQNINYGTGEPVWSGSPTNPPEAGTSFNTFSGGGNIGGTGDLGTGSAFAGGSMYGTQMGGGLWDYDCDTQGPSYNSAGECIACCN